MNDRGSRKVFCTRGSRRWPSIICLVALLACGDDAQRGSSADGAVLAGDGDGAAPSWQDAALDAGVPLPPHVPNGCNVELDKTVATRFYDVARCLFEGTDAAQREVDIPSLSAERIAVVRGRVLDRDGKPLVGVRVSVLHGSSYGYTLTRAEGHYDLAVHGGETVTLRYELPGRLLAQRQMRPEWRRFTVYPDVVLLPATTSMEHVKLSAQAAPRWLTGPMSKDQSGSRQHAVLLRPGTTATMQLPSGAAPLDDFDVGITEYTVGERGQLAMPGDLPPSSGYTYAVEFSVPQAKAAGATRVMFAPALITYVDNFLHFPAGTVVPNGSYDAERDAWQAGASGLVIKVLSVDAGRAMLDTDGDDKADSDSVLMALGIDDLERSQLATRYQAGSSLWRVPIEHFSCWDHNWPFGPPSDAIAAPLKVIALPTDGCGPSRPGSIVGCEEQSLGEAFPIDATPYALHYQSERMPGRLDARDLELSLSGETVPASLKRIELEVQVQGQLIKQTFDPKPNQRTAFRWDGQDAWGRKHQGRQMAQLRAGYVYDGAYRGTSSFGQPGQGVLVTGDRTRAEVTLWSSSHAALGQFEETGLGLGGLSISVHHVYDPEGHVLHRGDGTSIQADALGAVIETVVGDGNLGRKGDGGKATKASLFAPTALSIAPDGTVYIAEYGSNLIRRVRPDGVIDTYAGNGVEPIFEQPLGEGLLATQVALKSPHGLAHGRDGTLFYTETSFSELVRAIAPDGAVRTVAGSGDRKNDKGDGVPAVMATLRGPHALALAPGGTLYVSENGGRVRRIGSDGIITTYAGGGSVLRDGGPATSASLNSPFGIALGPDGSLYIAESNRSRIRKVEPGGLISTIAAGPDLAAVAPVDALIYRPTSLDVASDGTVYFTDAQGVGRVRTDGVIERIAGSRNRHRFQETAIGDHGPALSATFSRPAAVRVHPDGSLWVADDGDYRVRRIRSALPGFSLNQSLVGSSDGSEAYLFDQFGRHLETLDGLTGASLRKFEYDASGLLSAIVERDGQRTVITRAANGAPTSIVGPYGHTTKLDVDDQGLLRTWVRPSGEAMSFTFAAGGLLTKLERQGTSGMEATTFEYDAHGRLTRDVHPTGFAQSLSREELQDGRRVTRTLNESRRELFELARGAEGKLTRKHTDFDGRVTNSTRTSGETTVTSAARTLSASRVGDPRFGMVSPYNASVTLADGPVTVVSKQTRSVVLTDENNPLSVSSLDEQQTVNNRTTSSHWDAASRTWQMRSPAGRSARTTLDTHGRVLSKQFAGLTPTTYAYDDQGRLLEVAQGPAVSRFGYGQDGLLESATDALGRTQRYEHDANGRPIAVVLADGERVGLSYGAQDMLSSVTPPGRSAHQLGLGLGALPSGYTAPSASGSSSATLAYGYNTFLQLSSVTDANSRKLQLSYDPLSGRLLGLTQDGSNLALAYEDSTGSVKQLTTGETVVDLRYQGTVLTELTLSGATSGSVSRSHDANGWVSGQSVAGIGQAFTRDADGLLTSAGPQSVTRDSATGAVSKMDLGIVSEVYSHDSLGRAASYAASASGTELYSVSDERDALGRTIRRTERVQGAARKLDYTYDVRGRLIGVSAEGGPLESYAYDANDNRTSVRYGVDGPVSATYGVGDELLTLGSTTFTSDAAGNLTGNSRGARYAHDQRGQLRRATSPDGKLIEYLIDGLNRRVGKKVDSTLTRSWLYDFEGRVVAETSGSSASSSASAVFVYATRDHVPDFMLQGGRTYRLISDPTGSVRLVVDSADGSVAQRLSYDSFGRVLEDTRPGFQPFGFAGGLYDPDTGLVRFGARDYDAETGRWTARDPLLFGGRQSNLYVYVGGDPVNFVDPTGEVPILVSGLIGAFVGAGFGALGAVASKGDILHGAYAGAAGGLVAGLTMGILSAPGIMSLSLIAGTFSGFAGNAVQQAYAVKLALSTQGGFCGNGAPPFPRMSPGQLILAAATGGLLSGGLGTLVGAYVAGMSTAAQLMSDVTGAWIGASADLVSSTLVPQ